MFTYYIQYGGDPYERYQSMGTTGLDHFMRVFDSFPWVEEIAKANAKPYGSSPTLSVKNVIDGTDLWVSMSGNRHLNGYLLGYICLITKKRWLGFGKPKKIRWLEIYLTREMQLVKHFFSLYFSENHDQLQMDIRKLERFTALETPN